jgi:carboxypeptidase Q
MKSYGLSDVHLEPWTIPLGWQRGTATARLLEPDNGRSLTVASMGWTPGTNGPVEGDVIIFRARAKEDLVKYKGKLKNAIILQGAPSEIRPITDPPTVPGVGPAPDRRRDSSSGGPNREAPAAGGTAPATNGATPAAPVAGGAPPAGRDGPRSFGRSGDRQAMEEYMAFRRELSLFLRAEGVAVMLMDAGKPHGLLNMGGGWRDSGRGTDRASAPEPLPALFVTHEHYALLWRLASRPAPAHTRLAIEVSNSFVPGPLTVYNTVGEIPGSEKPDEFVVVGAHLDSWDLGQGTTDNGTGTCVVLETARMLMKSGVRPKRTIRFCLFTGEEQGLYGSKEYVKAHKDEMARTSLAIVHDTGTGRVTALGTQGRESLKGVFEKEFPSLKDVGVKDITTKRSFGSDHQSFDAAGVPGIMFTQDPAEYRFTHHSQSDTLDKAKEPDLVQGAQVMAVMALRVANLPSLLPRDPAPAGRERRGSQ